MRWTVSDIVIGIMLAFLVSFLFFPIGFRGLPPSLNTKQILGAIGVGLFVLNSIREQSVAFHKHTLWSLMIALTFSVWCYYSCVENGSLDYTYAKYYLSFAVWLGGGYAVVQFVKFRHGYVSLSIITHYLMIAALIQCISTLLVDNVPAFQDFVDKYIIQDNVAKQLGRLYGLGCSLDSGGVRFCIILVLMAHQMAYNKSLSDSKLLMRLYLASFFFITVVGCMIARTTMAGFFLGLGIMLVSYGIGIVGTLTKRQLRFYSAIAAVLLVGIGISVYLYNTDAALRKDFRFAFEGFFNYFETGEFRTSSSDRLMESMWIWPTDDRTWLIGDGLFEHFVHGTDIGYCRFTLYCGLIGLSLFSIFFIYNASVVSKRFKNAKLLSLALLALTFIIWVKVSTDIFQIYAILFCISSDFEIDDPTEDESESEDSQCNDEEIENATSICNSSRL